MLKVWDRVFPLEVLLNHNPQPTTDSRQRVAVDKCVLSLEPFAKVKEL